MDGKGNQVRCLSDPVTVSEEWSLENPLCAVRMRRRDRAMSLEPGNLLSMARWSFRVKCNSHFWDNPQSQMRICKNRCFLWNPPVHMNYAWLNGRRFTLVIRSLRALMNELSSAGVNRTPLKEEFTMKEKKEFWEDKEFSFFLSQKLRVLSVPWDKGPWEF